MEAFRGALEHSGCGGSNGSIFERAPDGKEYHVGGALLSGVVTRFSVEHSRRNAKLFAVLVAGPRKILLAKLATLRVSLRVTTF